MNNVCELRFSSHNICFDQWKGTRNGDGYLFPATRCNLNQIYPSVSFLQQLPLTRALKDFSFRVKTCGLVNVNQPLRWFSRVRQEKILSPFLALWGTCRRLSRFCKIDFATGSDTASCQDYEEYEFVYSFIYLIAFMTRFIEVSNRRPLLMFPYSIGEHQQGSSVEVINFLRLICLEVTNSHINWIPVRQQDFGSTKNSITN